VLISNATAGNGCNTGFSSAVNTLSREPSRFWNGCLL